MRRSHWLVAAVLLSLAVSATPAQAVRQAGMGGVPAPADGTVAPLLIRSGADWALCSAAVWRPRLLLTAGHCVVKQGSNAPVDEIRVFAPNSVLSLDADQPGAVPVARTWVRPGFANGTGTTPADDIAVIELAADLAPAAFTRLATQAEIAQWVQGRLPIDQTGYGLVSPTQDSTVAMTVTLPAVRYESGSRLGTTLSTQATAMTSSCPGDSGGPATRTEPFGRLLIGPVTGGVSPCINPGTPGLVNTVSVAANYLDVLNPALTSVGLPGIPSAPTVPYAVGRNASTVTVTWKAPAVGAENVTSYDVLSSDGTTVCVTNALSCTLRDLTPGSYAFHVRAVNAQGEGDAIAATSMTTLGVGPARRLPAPWLTRSSSGRTVIAFQTLRSVSSVPATRYVVTDQRGRTICSGKPPDAASTVLTCAVPTRAGVYRLKVRARTADGWTPRSPASVTFRIG